jgi:hypothetical protein
MARAVVEMSGRIHRACVAFCGDKSDGETAAEMFRILSETNDLGDAPLPENAGTKGK